MTTDQDAHALNDQNAPALGAALDVPKDLAAEQYVLGAMMLSQNAVTDANRGLFSEGASYSDAVLAQTGRRTTPLDMRPFTVDTETGRRQWRQMLLALEQRLALANTTPGMLADDLSDYLFACSTGHIGSLMTLINRGCQRAIRTGTERLDQDLLDCVKNDAASEKARQELEAALQTRRITTRPRSKTA